MKELFYRLSIIIITICLLTIMGSGLDSTSCWAQTEDTQTSPSGDDTLSASAGSGETTEEGDDDTSDTPVLANLAQVAHAENLAAASAEQANAEAEEAMEALDAAQKNLDDAIASEDEDAINAAQEAFDEAQEKADEAMSQIAGVSTSDIAGMREDGMGWGEIAHTLGIHPGVLGLGHTKRGLED